MQDEVFNLLTVRLRHAIKVYEERLRVVFQATVNEFDPRKQSNSGTVLSEYTQAILDELVNFTATVRDEAIRMAREFLLPLPPLVCGRLIGVVESCFGDALYLQRLDILDGALHRKAERSGLVSGRASLRTDVDSAAIKAAATNITRNAASAFRSDLECERLRFEYLGERKLPFAALARDVIDIFKPDGSSRALGRKASVQSDLIAIEAADILIEPNDLIIRRMSNGAQETFRVIDPDFSEGLGGIPPHYRSAIHAALKREHAFTGSYSAVRRMLQRSHPRQRCGCASRPPRPRRWTSAPAPCSPTPMARRDAPGPS